MSMHAPRRMTAVALTFALTLGLAGCGGMATRTQISTTPHCTEFVFPVYFAGSSAVLTKQAKQVIADAGRHTKGCTVAAVDVVGLADYRGPPAPNLELSRRRAQTVAEALGMIGFPAPSFKISVVGDAGALADDGAARPLRRKVTVLVTFVR